MEGSYADTAKVYTGSAIPGRNYAGSIVEPKVADRTELERLTGNLGRSQRRLRDMLDAFEARLDRVQMSPATLSQTSQSPPTPDPQPGTIAAVDAIDDRLSCDCDRLDALLCRLGKII